jgi:PleD family two-component response regulator
MSDPYLYGCHTFSTSKALGLKPFEYKMMDTQKILRVLVADDHSIFRDGFKLLLKKIKTPQLVLVGEAENGQQLIELNQEYKPDLIFTDIQMPGIDAAELYLCNTAGCAIDPPLFAWGRKVRTAKSNASR